LPVPGDVWAALTQPSRLGTWLRRIEGQPSDDGRFVIWHDEQTASRHTVTGWEADRLLLLLTWEFPGEEESHVSFVLRPDDGHTVLAVAHQRLADPISYAAGWHRHLEYLRAHLMGKDKDFADFWTGYYELVEGCRATAH